MLTYLEHSRLLSHIVAPLSVLNGKLLETKMCPSYFLVVLQR